MLSGYKAISHFRCLKYRSFASPFCCFASPFRCVAVSMFRSLVVSHRSIVVSHRPSGVLQSRIALSLFPISQFRCFVLSLFRTFVVSYFNSFALLLFRTFDVSYSDVLVNASVCHAGIHFSAETLV